MKCSFCDCEEIVVTEEKKTSIWWIWNFAFVMLFLIFLVLSISTLPYYAIEFSKLENNPRLMFLIGIIGMSATFTSNIIFNITGIFLSYKARLSKTKATCPKCHNFWYINKK